MNRFNMHFAVLGGISIVEHGEAAPSLPPSLHTSHIYFISSAVGGRGP